MKPQEQKTIEIAFEQQAPALRQRAVAVSRHCGATEAEADDIAQDVMLRLWQLRGEQRIGSMEALAVLMARHLTRNAQRRRPSATLDEGTVTAMATGGSPHEQLEEKENDEWLRQKLRTLPTTQHSILYMRQVERRSHDEIASLLGIGTASVSTLLARARRTLLEEIRKRNQL